MYNIFLARRQFIKAFIFWFSLSSKSIEFRIHIVLRNHVQKDIPVINAKDGLEFKVLI